jgi:hypothetical protein
MDHQRGVIYELQELVRAIPEFQQASAHDCLICLPTGDGMALAFFGDPIVPVRCARQIARQVKNNARLPLRIGIHTGPVYRVADVNANRNVAGGGINYAQRVMDCGDSGHILISRAIADILLQLSDWKAAVHDLGECEVKHGVVIQIFNVFTEEFGNSQVPAKVRTARRFGPSAEPNLGRLVAKMCDRRAQEEEFRHTYMDASEQCQGCPQMFFLLGEEGQCHESLVVRLMHRVGLTAGEGQDDTAAGRMKRIPWQHEGDLSQRATRLIYSLFENLGPRSNGAMRPKDLSPKAFGDLVGSALHAWIAIQHDLHAARWDSHTPELIGRYVEFLSGIPRTAGAPPVLVFVNIVLPRAQAAGWKKLVDSVLWSRGRKRVWSGLKALETSAGIPCRVLAELPPVTREDVLEWFSLNRIYDSEEKRIRAVDRLFPPGSRQQRAMWEIEAFCEEELQKFAGECGYGQPRRSQASLWTRPDLG